MKYTPEISKPQIKGGLAAVLGSLALALAGFSQAANAATPVYDYPYIQSGPYHEDILPNGTLTGPIAPEANGG